METPAAGSLERPLKYTCVGAFAEAEITEKRSKFIADATPVSGEDEAEVFLRKVRDKYRDARHHPYAYILYKNGIVRFSDDGEPQGTSGKPILDVLKGRGLFDSLIVVTRYFGGILLGAGGLVRVYSAAAALAAEKAGERVRKSAKLYRLSVVYRFYQPLLRLAGACGGRVADAKFGEKVILSVSVPDDSERNFPAEVLELTGGTTDIQFVKPLLE